jgi:hypothetical protein
MERAPLLGEAPRARVRMLLARVGGLAAVALLVVAALPGRWQSGGGPSQLLSLPLSLAPVEDAGTMQTPHNHVLYSDWRGTSLGACLSICSSNDLTICTYMYTYIQIYI